MHPKAETPKLRQISFLRLDRKQPSRQSSQLNRPAPPAVLEHVPPTLPERGSEAPRRIQPGPSLRRLDSAETSHVAGQGNLLQKQPYGALTAGLARRNHVQDVRVAETREYAHPEVPQGRGKLLQGREEILGAA